MGNIFIIMNNLQPTFKLVKNNPHMPNDIGSGKKWEAVHWQITINKNIFYYSEGVGLFTNGGRCRDTQLLQNVILQYKEGDNLRITDDKNILPGVYISNLVRKGLGFDIEALREHYQDY